MPNCCLFWALGGGSMSSALSTSSKGINNLAMKPDAVHQLLPMKLSEQGDPTGDRQPSKPSPKHGSSR